MRRAELCSCWGCTITSLPGANLQETVSKDTHSSISLLASSLQHSHTVTSSMLTQKLSAPALFLLLPFPLTRKSHVKG